MLCGQELYHWAKDWVPEGIWRAGPPSAWLQRARGDMASVPRVWGQTSPLCPPLSDLPSILNQEEGTQAQLVPSHKGRKPRGAIQGGSRVSYTSK